MVKAESLYNLCDFEHALVLFTKGEKLAPDSDGIQAGILKCKKTILNKISDEDVFFFSGSKYFIDYLRKQGDKSIDSFISDDDSEKNWKKTFTLVSLSNKKGQAGEVEKKDKMDKRSAEKVTKRTNKQDRMKKDKEYLRELEKKLAPLSGSVKDVVRYCFFSFGLL